LFNFFRHYKSPPFHFLIRIHLISLSYHISVVLTSHFSFMEHMLMFTLMFNDFTFVELPQVSSIVETYGTDGFVRVEFPYKMVLKLSRYDVQFLRSRRAFNSSHRHHQQGKHIASSPALPLHIFDDSHVTFQRRHMRTHTYNPPKDHVK